MAVAASATEAPPATPASPPPRAPATFDERWAAWQAKGAVHDNAVRRKTTIAVSMLIAGWVVALYALFGR